jgi:hypothetical protein
VSSTTFTKWNNESLIDFSLTGGRTVSDTRRGEVFASGRKTNLGRNRCRFFVRWGRAIQPKEPIMYRNSLAALIITATVATTPTAVFAEDDPSEPMNRRIGTWVVKNHQKKAAWTPAARTDTGVETVKWVLDKKFIQGDVIYADGRKAHWLMNYDSQAKVYRSWHFDSQYVFPRGNTVGRWDAKAKRMDWKMDLGNGVHGKMTFKDLDKDTSQWSLIAHDASGKLMFDGGGKLTRKKK